MNNADAKWVDETVSRISGELLESIGEADRRKLIYERDLFRKSYLYLIQGRRKPQTVCRICEWCGRSFEGNVRAMAHTRFCSRKCRSLPVGTYGPSSAPWRKCYELLATNRNLEATIVMLLQMTGEDDPHGFKTGRGCGSAYQKVYSTFVQFSEELGLTRSTGAGGAWFYRCVKPNLARREEKCGE